MESKVIEIVVGQRVGKWTVDKLFSGTNLVFVKCDCNIVKKVNISE